MFLLVGPGLLALVGKLAHIFTLFYFVLLFLGFPLLVREFQPPWLPAGVQNGSLTLDSRVSSSNSKNPSDHWPRFSAVLDCALRVSPPPPPRGSSSVV